MAVTDPNTDSTRERRRWFLALRLIVTAGLVGFLVKNYLPLELLRTTGWKIAPSLLSGLLLVMVTLLLGAVRWRLIGLAIEAPLSMSRGTVLVFMGQFFNQVLPTSFGGDAVRVWGARANGLTLKLAVTSVTLDRICGLVALVMFAAVGVPILAIRLQSPWLAVFGVVLVFGVPVFILTIARFSTLSILQGGGKVGALLRALIGSIARLTERPFTALAILALSLFMHYVAIVLTVVIANALGSPISLVDGVLILPSVLFISSLPISIAGWGVREAGLAGGFILLGLPGDAAVTTSILVGLIYIVAGLPGALLFLLEKERSRLSAPPAS